jgi:hypothetical protein
VFTVCKWEVCKEEGGSLWCMTWPWPVQAPWLLMSGLDSCAPRPKHTQAHLSIIPGLHQSHNSPAVGWEHEADCAHDSGAICSLELDLCCHVSAYSCIGLSREDQSAPHNEQQLEVLHQLQAKHQRGVTCGAEHSGAVDPSATAPVLWLAGPKPSRA